MPTVHVNDFTFIHIPKTAGFSITNWFTKNIEGVQVRGMHLTTEMTRIKTQQTCAVVRNPWERTVSLWAFWNKIHKKDIPFDIFVRNLKDYKIAAYSWFTFDTPQKAWIPNGVTYLLKFETLEEDFKIIQEKFECTEPLLRVNTSEHDDYKTYYTLETKDIIADVFKDDIEAFGYTF